MTHDCATPPQELPTRRQMTYLPSVQSGDDGDVSAQADPMVAELIALLRDHGDQGRPAMAADACLMEAARDKAYRMAMAQRMDHVLDGEGPNRMLRRHNCGIPDWYPDAIDANNVESIARGYSGPAQMVDAWMASTGHRKHVLGLSAFFAEQTRVGAAVYWDALGHPWWCFLSTPSREAD